MAKKLSLIVLLVLLFSLLSGCFESSEDKGEDFVFTALDGTTKHLSDYRRKVVILDLMGASCPPCAIQMFELGKIYENYDSGDVVILSIDVWIVWGETSQDVRDFKAGFSCVSPCEAEDNFPNLYLRELKEMYNKQDGIDLDWTFGLDDKSGSIFYKYVGEDKGVPTLCIFDQEGNLHFQHSGISVFSEIPSFLSGVSPPPPKLGPEIDELLE